MKIYRTVIVFCQMFYIFPVNKTIYIDSLGMEGSEADRR